MKNHETNENIGFIIFDKNILYNIEILDKYKGLKLGSRLLSVFETYAINYYGEVIANNVLNEEFFFHYDYKPISKKSNNFIFRPKSLDILLENEINQIQDKKLREFTRMVLSNVPLFYSVIPSSSTSQFHPVDETYRGGQVKHFIKTFKMIEHSGRRYGINKKIYDVLRVSALLHDVPFKFSIKNLSNKCNCSKECSNYFKCSEYSNIIIKHNKEHPFSNAMYLIRYMSKFKDIKFELSNIINAIYYHMGRWADYDSELANSVKKEFPFNEESIFVKCLQEADYYSTRKNVLVN